MTNYDFKTSQKSQKLSAVFVELHLNVIIIFMNRLLFKKIFHECTEGH